MSISDGWWPNGNVQSGMDVVIFILESFPGIFAENARPCEIDIGMGRYPSWLVANKGLAWDSLDIKALVLVGDCFWSILFGW